MADSTGGALELRNHGQRRREVKRRFRENLPLLSLFVPVLLFYLIFKYVPMFGAIMAFKNYNFTDGILHSPWIGLDNFKILFSNPQTINIIRNTLVLSVLNIVVGFPIPILLAILLNEVRRQWFKKWVQTLVYLPHFFSWVIVGGIVVTMFAEQNGIINAVLERMTGNTFPFLYDEGSWIAIFLGAGIWKEAGFSTIIFLAAITSIDPSLYEAASMDGASKWRQIINITLPGISATIVLLLILQMGSVMSVGFDPVYVLQNSGVYNVSEVISTYIYKVGIQGGQFSLTSAMGLFESIVGFVLVFSANLVARRFGNGLW
ncbi:putative multiple-sugar transport system permease YteP [Paenibacillus antibioticophila]|uniref:Multiple-sugar transport system permease YteP n=1 Tax=Paenibacillus antibioticophila TaxID=1274374 RepID=A0A920CKC9_9BACL|nr:ABC transporter permease subunit [Paenibacillus antibioticophila]GIO39852.1 putative multiple-sugar transport system permease YteP [Paenibacillus antibioticophila]